MKITQTNYLKLPHIGHRWRFLQNDEQKKFKRSYSLTYEKSFKIDTKSETKVDQQVNEIVNNILKQYEKDNQYNYYIDERVKSRQNKKRIQLDEFKTIHNNQSTLIQEQKTQINIGKVNLLHETITKHPDFIYEPNPKQHTLKVERRSIHQSLQKKQKNAVDYQMKMTKLLLKHQILSQKKMLPTLKCKNILYN